MTISFNKLAPSPWMATACSLALWVLAFLLASTVAAMSAFWLYFTMANLSFVQASSTCLGGGFWSFYDCYHDHPRYTVLFQFLLLPTLAIAVYWSARHVKLPVRSVLALNRPHGKQAAFWIGVALAWAAMSLFYYHWTNTYQIGWEPFDRRTLLLAIPIMLLPPLYEELVFRGFLLSWLTHRCSSVWWPVIVISALFTVAHGFDRSAFFMVSTFLFSLLLCWARLRTGTLWVPIAMQTVVNLQGLAVTGA